MHIFPCLECKENAVVLFFPLVSCFKALPVFLPVSVSPSAQLAALLTACVYNEPIVIRAPGLSSLTLPEPGWFGIPRTIWNFTEVSLTYANYDVAIIEPVLRHLILWCGSRQMFISRVSRSHSGEEEDYVDHFPLEGCAVCLWTCFGWRRFVFTPVSFTLTHTCDKPILWWTNGSVQSLLTHPEPEWQLWTECECNLGS